MSRFEKSLAPHDEQPIEKEQGDPAQRNHTDQMPDSSLEPSQITQTELLDAQNMTEKIQALETVLGKLPETRSSNTATIGKKMAAITQTKRPQEMASASDNTTPDSDKTLEGTSSQEKASRNISLHEKRIISRVEEINNAFSRIERTITEDAQFSRSILKVGKVIEKWGSIDEIAKVTRAFSDNIITLSRESDKNRKLAMTREGQTKIGTLANKMDDFHSALSVLQKKIQNYYDGRSSEDEDMLRKLQQQLRNAFEGLKDINRLYRDEESLLADYNKSFPDEDKL